MVTNNICTEIGDELLFSSFSLITGVVDLIDYSDDVEGETSTRFFNRYFRYTLNGIIYSAWLPLTDNNINAIDISPSDEIIFEFRFIRAGSDTTGELKMNSVTINGQFGGHDCITTIRDTTVFAGITCDDPLQFEACNNLLKKLYEKGIVPKFIRRGPELEEGENDVDYLAFWDTVGCFFALFITLMKRLVNYYDDPEKIKEYIRQNGFFICGDEPLADLQTIVNNFYDEARLRGTDQVLKKKGVNNIVLPTETITYTKDIDGEFLRLICYNKLADEFIFNLTRPEKIGWNINNSSPLYCGVSDQIQFNKAPENSQDILSLTGYSLYNADGGDINIVTDSAKKVIKIENVPNGEIAGISPNINNLPTSDFDKAIIIDPQLDYEITFWCKQSVLSDSIQFGCYGFDKDNNIVDIKSIYDNSVTNTFFIDRDLNKTDKYYFIRGILFNKDQPLIPTNGARLNIGFGYNLKLPASIVKIFPFIAMKGVGSNDLFIWDIKVKPLVNGACLNTVKEFSDKYSIDIPKRGTFSTGFIQMKNLIQVVYKNNRGDISNDKVEEIAERFLFPFNFHYRTTRLTEDVAN